MNCLLLVKVGFVLKDKQSFQPHSQVDKAKLCVWHYKQMRVVLFLVKNKFPSISLTASYTCKQHGDVNAALAAHPGAVYVAESADSETSEATTAQD